MTAQRDVGACAGKKGPSRKNKPKRRRLCLKETATEEGDGFVVKGVSKRVIVVKPPDERIFEQAIFIIREDYAGECGVSQEEILRQARRAAGEYLGRGKRRAARGLRPPLYAAAGAAATGLAWLAAYMVRL